MEASMCRGQGPARGPSRPDRNGLIKQEDATKSSSINQHQPKFIEEPSKRVKGLRLKWDGDGSSIFQIRGCSKEIKVNGDQFYKIIDIVVFCLNPRSDPIKNI